MGKGLFFGALTHANPFVRGLAAWSVGLGLALAAWIAAYRWLPEQAMSSVSLAQHAPLDLTGGTDSLALRIFAWNAALGGGAILLVSLFRVGRLPLGFLAPWAWFIAGSSSARTRSPSPAPEAKIAPHLSITWQHVGLRELSAYLLLPPGSRTPTSGGIDRGSTFASSGCDGSRTLG